MAACSYRRSALALALVGTVASPGRATEYPYTVLIDTGASESLARGDRIAISGPVPGRAIEVRQRASFDAYGIDVVNQTSGNRTRHAYGLLAYGEASALLAESRLVASGTRAIGIHAQGASTITLQDVALDMPAAESVGISSRSGSLINANGVQVHVQGDDAIGILALGPQSRIVGSGLSVVHAGERRGTRAAFDVAEAVAVREGATIELSKSVLSTTQAGVDTVSIHGPTSAFTAADTRIVAEGAGSSAIKLAGGRASIVGGEIRGAGHAIRSVGDDASEATVTVAGGAHVTGRIENADQPLTFTARDSEVHGDIASVGNGPLVVALANTYWRGAGDRLASVDMTDGLWHVAGDSSVHRLTLHGPARIAVADDAPPSSLRVGSFGNASGEGSITLRTRLDAGGTNDQQLTDRLLVAGDVAGSTSLRIVNLGGAGADTSPLTNEPRPVDGISVVQVGGSADAHSFRLAGGYIAAGPWQYVLVAYAPGSADAGQRLLAGEGNAHWDYRLQSNRIDAAGLPVNDAVVKTTRPRLVPQVPTYLVLANALFGYGRKSMEAWRPVDAAAPRNPAWRVRTFGGQAAYRSNLPFQRYAVDYVRSDRGLQVAGDMLAWGQGSTTMRTGLGLSTGTSRIAPRAVDGVSHAKVQARGVAANYVLETDSGWHADASYGFTHYRIDVNTPQRGEALGRLRANGNEAAVGGGFRWAPGERLVLEPAASVLWQRLRFVSGRDRDGLMVRPGSPERLTLRGGARASMAFEPRGNVLYAWTPYIDTRYTVTRGSGESVEVSGVRLATGRAGRAAELATGVAIQFRGGLTAHVDLTARARVGRAGESGMSARAGIAYMF